MPLHDLRTMIADLLRRVDPARARDLIASMLGHRSEAAGEEYRAACEGDWASREWRRDRGVIGEGGLPLSTEIPAGTSLGSEKMCGQAGGFVSAAPDTHPDPRHRTRRQVMDHRPKRSRHQPADEAAPAGRLLPQIIADIERRSEEQARDIADLRTLVETTVAEKQKIAARLGEAEHELAEALAALEIERQKRQQAEAWTARFAEANRIARAALDLSADEAEPDGLEAAGEVDIGPAQDDAPADNEDALALLSDEDREEPSRMAADAGLSRQAMVALLCQRAIAERRDRLMSRQQAGGSAAIDVAGMSP